MDKFFQAVLDKMKIATNFEFALFILFTLIIDCFLVIFLSHLTFQEQIKSGELTEAKGFLTLLLPSALLSSVLIFLKLSYKSHREKIANELLLILAQKENDSIQKIKEAEAREGIIRKIDVLNNNENSMLFIILLSKNIRSFDIDGFVNTYDQFPFIDALKTLHTCSIIKKETLNHEANAAIYQINNHVYDEVKNHFRKMIQCFISISFLNEEEKSLFIRIARENNGANFSLIQLAQDEFLYDIFRAPSQKIAYDFKRKIIKLFEYIGVEIELPDQILEKYNPELLDDKTIVSVIDLFEETRLEISEQININFPKTIITYYIKD